jgi:hypothetical protein
MTYGKLLQGFVRVVIIKKEVKKTKKIMFTIV